MSRLQSLPGIAKLFLGDLRDYLTRLYVRASWQRQGLHLSRSAQLHYQHRDQIKIFGKCSIGPFSIVLVIAPKNENCAPLLLIGDRTYIGDHCNIRPAGGAIHIGQRVLIANNVTIVASNHCTRLGKPIIDQDWKRGDVLIEDDVWIGAGAVILPGATIKTGAVIAAGAVVRGEVPGNAIYGGIPAKQIGLRS
ncbi:MAG: acyltransferase [Limisphaerales bacterium]